MELPLTEEHGRAAVRNMNLHSSCGDLRLFKLPGSTQPALLAANALHLELEDMPSALQLSASEQATCHFPNAFAITQ